MTRMLATLAVVSLCSFLAAGARANTVTYVSQSRTVDATSSASDSQTSDNDADNDLAPDFGSFQGAVAASVILSGAIGTGTAIQSSTLLPYRIDASGNHSANGEGWEPDAFGSGSGQSRFDVAFDLATSCDFDLAGYVEAYDSGSTSFSLTGPDGFSLTFFPPFNDQTVIAESGTLAAGRYLLVINSAGSAFGDEFFYDYASGAYDITLLFAGAVAAPEVTSGSPLAIAPNPFRSSTRIQWGIPSSSAADVTIFDVQGRLVVGIAQGAAQLGSMEWDGRDDSGRPVPAGVYFVRVQGAERSELRKLVRTR